MHNGDKPMMGGGEEVWRALFDLLPDGVLILDPESARPLFFNRIAHEQLGYSAEEFAQTPIPAYEALESPEETRSRIEKVLREGRDDFVTRHRRKDGTLMDVQVTVMSTTLGGEPGFLAVFRDISELKRAEEENRAKSRFLASMSHELRTPLNAILGYAQLMELQEGVPKAMLENAREIGRAGNHLLALVNEVLDLARIESGRVELHPERIALLDLLGECHSHHVRAAAARQISLFNGEGCDGLYLLADRRRLLQVLHNLLSNAIKYNRPEGRVTIHCSRPDADHVRIAVTDTGPGISAEKQRELFQPFNRLGAEMGEVEGTGIGLLITRQLVELMGGALGLESHPGAGSTFWVDLPVAKAGAEKPERTASRDRREAPLPQGARVLVVEDYLPNQLLLKQQLRRLGCDVDVVADGEAALARWREGEYHLIFTDLNMPRMDGCQLAHIIRKEEGGKDLPIIAITAAGVSGELQRCREAGMNDALAKPVALEGLRSVLARWLPTSESDEAPTPTSERDETKRGAVLDTHRLHELLGSQERALTEEILHSFLDTARAGLKQLESSPEDAVAFARELHKQKSSARTVGALQYAARVEGVEKRARQGVIDPAALPELQQALETVATAATAFIEENSQPTEPPAEESPLAGSVLVVDDDPVLLRQMSALLVRLGVRKVVTADTGREALQRLLHGANPFELLICDLNMPEMDGVEFARELVNHRYPGGIILISGEDNRTLQAAEMLIGAHGLQVAGSLRKPIEPDSLTPLLRQVFPAQGDTGRPAIKKQYSAVELQHAIANGELENHYQPKIDLTSGAWIGVETLVRWRHPDDGLIYPDRFIGVAEEHGVINDLTRAVLAQAVSQAWQWREMGLDLRTAVNISMDNLGALDFPDHLAAQAAAADIGPERIILEITESRLMRDLLTALDILTRLRLKKFHLSIDDFGTGHSSLSQLRDLPFDQLKVDRSFVHDAIHNSTKRAIYEGSLRMAKQLGMEVVGEGVENRDDWDFLRRSGCHIAQGYFIAKPMPADQLVDWHEHWKARVVGEKLIS